MGWKFNPFTGTLDNSPGPGATVFDGEVATFSALPQTIDTPPVGSAYLVRESEGTVWFGNKKQNGVYIRTNNTGVRATDWTYGGEYPVNSVNGQTGAVVLTNISVGAAAATHGANHFDDDVIYNEMVKVSNAGRSTVNGYYYLANDGGENDYILVGSKRLGRIVERSLKWEIEYNGTVYYRSEQKAGPTIWSPWEYTTWTVVTGSGDNPAPQVTQAHAVEVIDGLSRKIDYSGVGKLGSTSGLPVLTGTDGVLETGIFGSASGQFCEGNDSRLSNARTPSNHAASHGPSGSDPVTLEDLTNTQIQNGSLITWNDGQPYGIIDTSWGGNSASYGGSINTSSGGGSITTNGTGLIELGEVGTRTTLTGTATADRAISLPDASGTLALTTTAPASHTHGNLTNSGAIGSTSGLPVVTTTSGAITTLALGAANTVLKVNSGGTAVEFGAAAASGATNIWIPASAWIPRTTTGCGVDSREQATNKVNTDELLFDTATEEYAQAMVVMPSNYNNSTVTARFYWTASSGSGGVAWGLRGRAYADDDALDAAQGTGQVVTDTFLLANDMHVTSATSAITLAGTPAANRPVQYEVYRSVANASDTLAVDACLLGVEIIFN